MIVAKEIEREDACENMGAQSVREVANKTSDTAGDGTTTAAVLAEAISSAGLKDMKPMKSMKSPDIENIVVDEVHQLTYVVMAHKVLNDGELYSAIRLELLKRRSFPARGERLVITAPKVR